MEIYQIQRTFKVYNVTCKLTPEIMIGTKRKVLQLALKEMNEWEKKIILKCHNLGMQTHFACSPYNAHFSYCINLCT